MNTKKLVATIIATALTPLIGLAGGATAPDVPIWGALDSIINWLFGILIVVAIIFFIIAAFQFVTGGGDPEKVDSARKMVLYGIIGLIVAIFARGLIPFVCNVFGVGCAV